MPVSLFRMIDPPAPVAVVAARVSARPGVGRAGRDGVGGWIVYHPRYEAFLCRVGVATPDAAYSLPGEVVSGHADRHVVRAELRAGAARKTVFLKREHATPYGAKLRNRRDGFGWVSRAEREAEVLRALEEQGLPGPQWLAYGADGSGRAFLIIDELAGAIDLPRLLRDGDLSAPQRHAAVTGAARAVAAIHAAGIATPDLCAKHVMVQPATGAATLIDWQSARLTPAAAPDAHVAHLANLEASAPDAVTPRERVRFLAAYLREMRRRGAAVPPLQPLAEEIRRRARPRQARSSVREQRAPALDQRLVWLAGESVCVVPELVSGWADPADGAPFYVTGEEVELAEERITFAGGRRAVLTRFHTWDPLGRGLARLRERPWRSPGANAARVLFHLARHGIPGPALLAFGQRDTGRARADSFVLTPADSAAVPLNAALSGAGLTRAARAAILTDCGRLLGKLNGAGLRLDPGRVNRPIFGLADGGLRVLSAIGLRRLRRFPDGRRVTELRRLFRCELPGLSRPDRARVLRGYLGERWADRTARRRFLAGIR